MQSAPRIPPVIAVSSCLLGTACRYDGKSKPAAWLDAWHGKVLWLPICPEMLAGMGVPRPPIEHVRRKGRWRVETPDGTNVMPRLLRVAERLVPWFEQFGVAGAILKERSPSCGVNQIYALTLPSPEMGEGILSTLPSPEMGEGILSTLPSPEMGEGILSKELCNGRGVIAHRLGLEGYRLFTEADEAEFAAWVTSLDTVEHRE